MKKTVFFVCFLLFSFAIKSPCSGKQRLPAMRVAGPPIIDGFANDPAWKNAQAIVTLDKANNLPITIKAIYTDKEIFLQVSFSDPDESRTHKSWTWDKGRKIYTVGHDREDIFIVKWNMLSEPVDLSIFADDPYQADIWYWKACRSDAAGFADDKIHIYSKTAERYATRIVSRSGNIMYLLRRGDDGTQAYIIDLITEYQGDVVSRYITQQPTGSRSDVQSKGVWENGTWTIEFRRKLITTYQDDIQFISGKKFLLGVSRYEIAGRKTNQKLSDPLYGTGDINEPLWLEFIE